MDKSHANALLVASFIIFMFGIVIAVVTEILKGPALVVSLSISIATAFGPIAIITLFLKAGFDSVLYEAAEKNLVKAIENQKSELDATRLKLNEQLENCRKQSQNLIDNTVTLSVLRRCGIIDAFEKRDKAFSRIKSWLRDRNNREFVFVGTSFRGLYWKKKGDEEIRDLIKERINEDRALLKDPDSLFFRFIFTHPAFAYLREKAEGKERSERLDSQYIKIREEILKSVLILRKIGIPERCIKFFNGTPTMFGIMTDEEMLLNPYPYKKQSYTSFGIIVKKSTEYEQLSLYDIYRDAHFEGVWRDTDNTTIWQDSKLEEFWTSTLDSVVNENLDNEVPSELKKLLDDVKT
jgi:hypothetical protein